MAPMTTRIANTEKHWLVLCSGYLKCLLSIGIPVHRIVGMLKQVGTGFLDESVRHIGDGTNNFPEGKYSVSLIPEALPDVLFFLILLTGEDHGMVSS